jgi:hypothetical protein
MISFDYSVLVHHTKNCLIRFLEVRKCLYRCFVYAKQYLLMGQLEFYRSNSMPRMLLRQSVLFSSN